MRAAGEVRKHELMTLSTNLHAKTLQMLKNIDILLIVQMKTNVRLCSVCTNLVEREKKV
jgi:hypothetical protein